MAFVGPGMAVRVIEVEGPLPVVAAHMSRQPAVQEFERQLTDLISVPRDMGTPDGAREFFARASMECVLSPPPRPAGLSSRSEQRAATRRFRRKGTRSCRR
jgi:hypothetical protein